MQKEPEAFAFANAIINAEFRLLSAFSAFEISVAWSHRKGAEGKQGVDNLLNELDIDIVAFDMVQIQLAWNAWFHFGKGHNPAKLNIGDCCSHALAKLTGEPLLFKGDDFSKTDLLLVSSI